MPSFYGAGISMRLAALPLEDSVTSDIVRNKGPKASQNVEEAKEKLLRSKFLEEERVNFPGDEEGCALNWLGDGAFLQVLVSGEAFEEKKSGGKGGLSSSELLLATSPQEEQGQTQMKEAHKGCPPVQGATRSGRSGPVLEEEGNEQMVEIPTKGHRSTRRSTRSNRSLSTATSYTPLSSINPALSQMRPAVEHSAQNIEMKPKALVLHVKLSEKTFCDPFSNGTKQHLKIDVFFNGQLSSCVHIHPHDVRAGIKSMHQLFAGTRVDLLMERPWVILPPTQTADGSQGSSKKDSEVLERWDHISKELTKEVIARGTDKNGKRPPSAQFLKQLAEMRMPDGINEMQSPNGKRFGVIDAVVTVGSGKKAQNGTSYLTRPMRLIDKTYVHGGELDVDEQDQSLVDLDADGESDPDHEMVSSAMPAIPTARPPSDLGPLPVFCDPFTGTQLSSNPSTQTSSLGIPPSSYTSPHTSLYLPSDDPDGSQSRKRGFSDYITSAYEEHAHAEGRMRERNTRQSYPSAHASSAAPRGPGLQAYSGSGFNLNQYDGFMHADPYQLPYENMMFGLDSADFLGLNPFDEPASTPFGYHSLGQLALPRTDSSRPDFGQGLESRASLSMSSPFRAPKLLPPQARRVSFGHANVAAFRQGAPPNEFTSVQGISNLSPLGLPRSVYGGSPLMQRDMRPSGPPFPDHTESFMPAFRRSSVGPPPPKAFFSVTRKPQTPLPKKPGYIDPDLPRPSFLLQRLIITGKKGVRIIDHSWKTPQRIVIKPSSTVLKRPAMTGTRVMKSRQESPGSAEYAESALASRRRNTATTMATPQPISPQMRGLPGMASSMDKTKRDSVHDTHVTVPSSRPVATIRTVNAKEADNKVNARRRMPSNGILGIQGPKASLFVFDDPEELLRKKPKVCSSDQSHSASLAKVSTTPLGEVDIVVGESESKVMDNLSATAVPETGASSPLSSPPSSPVIPAVYGADDVGDTITLALPPVAQTASAILTTSQLPPPPSARGPSRSIETSLSPRSNEPFRELAPVGPDTPAPVTRKKNTAGLLQSTKRSRRKNPIDPDRLSGSEDPPLNKDCIIQYAVSDENGSTLRQVKSEWQGEFSEESVLVGMRFFVAGQ